MNSVMKTVKKILSASIAVTMLAGTAAFAQNPAPAPAPAARPAAPAPPAPPAAPAPVTRPQTREPAPPLPPPAPAPPRAPRAQRPDVPAQLVNIRIDVTITEEGGGGAATRKTSSLVLADRQAGSVRAFGRREGNPAPSRLNVDAFPMLQRDGRVQLQVTLEYGMAGDDVSVRVEPLLESAKPVMVSQATSPLTDRRTTVELTATVLR